MTDPDILTRIEAAVGELAALDYPPVWIGEEGMTPEAYLWLEGLNAELLQEMWDQMPREDRALVWEEIWEEMPDELRERLPDEMREKPPEKGQELPEWLREVLWYVYEDYEIEVHKNEAFVLASKSAQPYNDEPFFIAGAAPTRIYAPLADHPDLFLRFARLVPEGGGHITPETMRKWAKEYGLLGTHRQDSLLDLLPSERLLIVDGGRDGLAESHPHFLSCVREASRTLRLYEALKARDGSGVKTLRRMYSPLGESMTPNALEEKAMNEVWRLVQGHLEAQTYMMPYALDDGSFVEGPGFHSLLGAMWIQMWWILKAGDDISQCPGPGCHSIIDYEEPPAAYQGPTARQNRKRAPYKTRRDKVFCRKSCYQLWRYHEKKAGRSGRLSDMLDTAKTTANTRSSRS